MFLVRTAYLAFFLLLIPVSAAEAPGEIRGRVKLAATGEPLHHAMVVLSPLGKRVQTDDEGEFSFPGLAPGPYEVLAHMHALSDDKQTVTVEAGKTRWVEFSLALAAVHEQVTVTASGQEQTASSAFQTVTSLEGYELPLKSSSTSLGDLLQNETGVAKRSGGPGSSRPVVRGFDGDRVLVMQDGINTGTLSSQSGDHGEPVDATDLERVEVVRGPATLLYGGNAIGGVVNILTGHHILHQHPHEGLNAALTGVAGSNNGQGGGSASFEYGRGDWLLTGAGGGMHTGDYASAAGKVLNSHAWMSNAQVGAGHYNERFGSFYNYNHQEGRYGVPTAPGETGNVDLVWRRDNLRFQGEWHAPAAWLDDIQLSANFSDWNHREMEGGQTGTEFSNRQVITRLVAVQKPRGRWSGSFGGSTLWRDYQARGAEALTPPVRGQSYAAFILEELSFRRARLQFGSRLEHSSYSPDGLAARGFTGASTSAGASLPLWKSGAVVVNYMHSWRAPALEELYNHGPHPGNGVYEIGSTGLQREAGDGVEASLRHQGNRVRAEFNLFRYQMHDFVYLQPTGAMLEGLIAARYQQNDARFLGAESKLNVKLRENLWLITGGDLVQAKLTASGQSLPRIPPSRLRLGLDWHWKSLNVRPEWTLANRQWMTAPNETPTAGYGTGSLAASYSIVRKHAMHTFQFTAFNLNNRLYENHLSFIKAFAPEIGRGVRVGYTLQLF